MIVEDNFSRRNLVEGRSEGVSFSFLERKNNETCTAVSPLSACKDFLHDFLFVEIFKKPVSKIYGYEHTFNNYFTKKRVNYILCSNIPTRIDISESDNIAWIYRHFNNYMKLSADFINYYKNIPSLMGSFLADITGKKVTCNLKSELDDTIYNNTSSDKRKFFTIIPSFVMSITTSSIKKNPLYFGAASLIAREFYNLTDTYSNLVSCINTMIATDPKYSINTAIHWFISQPIDTQKEILDSYNIHLDKYDNTMVHNSGIQHFINKYLSKNSISLYAWKNNHPAYNAQKDLYKSKKVEPVC